MNVVEEKWNEIIEHLRVEHELSHISFSTWIQPLKVYNVVDNTVYLLVDKAASVDYIEKKYSLPLKVCIAEITGIEYEVVFLSEEDERKLITAVIVCEYLLKLPQTDYSSALNDIAICEAPVAHARSFSSCCGEMKDGISVA